MDDSHSEDCSASRFDGRFDAAAADFHRAQGLFIGELLLHISKLVRQDYPAATLILTDGQFHDDGELKVRVQQVLAGTELLFDIEADGEFGNLDDIDGKLCWLGLLNPDDYLGDQEIDLWSDQDLPGPAANQPPARQATR